MKSKFKSNLNLKFKIELLGDDDCNIGWLRSDDKVRQFENFNKLLISKFQLKIKLL